MTKFFSIYDGCGKGIDCNVCLTAATTVIFQFNVLFT